MLTDPLQTGNAIQDMLNSLIKQADANQDGVVTTDEFGQFLTSLLDAKTSTGQATGTDQAGTTSTTSSDGTAAGAGGTGQGSTTAGASDATGGTTTQAAAPASLASRMSFEGFDLVRAQDPSKSAKDAFALAASTSGVMPTSKQDAESWFNQHIRASMEAKGHTINWVQGDKFEFTNWQGTYVVDFVRNAGTSHAALAWQAGASSGTIMTGGTPPSAPAPAPSPNQPLQATFDQLAKASGVVPQTKPEAETWFNQHIRPGLESQGVRINWVIGDKFEYAGPSGPVVIDFIVGAGGPSPQLGWLAE